MLFHLLLALLNVAEAAGDEGSPRKSLVDLGLRAGSSLIFGASGPAWGPTLAWGALLDMRLGPQTCLSLEVDRAVHGIDDSESLFDEPLGPIGGGLVGGSQAFLGLDIGFHFDLLRKAPYSGASIMPWLRVGAAMDLTDTRVQVPTFDGFWELRSQRPMFGLSPELGLSFNFMRNFSARLFAKGTVLPGLDHDEVDNSDRASVEWRSMAGVDLMFHL